MDLIFFLIPLGFFVGFVSSIAGGGGVFGLPALIALGVPPVNALALNRISDLGNICGSLKNYVTAGEFNKKIAFMAIPPVLVGAYLGANFVLGLDEGLLNKVILIAVLFGVFLLLYPFKVKERTGKPSLLLGVFFLFLLGIWDGAFAMAGGTFGVLIFVLIFRQSYVGAKSIVTFATIPEALLSTVILTSHSTVNLYDGFAMFSSACFGAYFGSKFAIKKGSGFIRYAMAGMAIIMVFKILIFDVFAFGA